MLCVFRRDGVGEMAPSERYVDIEASSVEDADSQANKLGLGTLTYPSEAFVGEPTRHELRAWRTRLRGTPAEEIAHVAVGHCAIS